VEALIAGWVAGYAMAVLSTVALTCVAWSSRDPRFFRRFFGEGVPAALVAVPASLGFFLVWTLAGVVLGAAYDLGGLDSQANALGSRSAPFLVGMAAAGAMPLPLLVLFFPRRWWLWCSMSGAFVGLFGWLMPLLAGR